jgi:hypothetical protein
MVAANRIRSLRIVTITLFSSRYSITTQQTSGGLRAI